jgi:Protein chain release factor B
MTIRHDYYINERLAIPDHEVWYEFSHASGPGGQNVNKVSSVATLCFAPQASGALTDWQKNRVMARLARFINSDGILKITSSVERSQSANRADAAGRFRFLVNEALKPVKKRTPTKPTRASRERRLADKKRQAARKQDRRQSDDDV